MDREGVTVLRRPMVHVDDRHTSPVLLQEESCDETDWTGSDDQDFRIRLTGHCAFSSREEIGVGMNFSFCRARISTWCGRN